MNYKIILHGETSFTHALSKSKYRGGFIKGVNTKEYNHDYYIHNKDKWKNDRSGPQKVKTDKVNTTGMDTKTKTACHKYKYRVTYNGRYRYFYTDAEYYSFLKNVKKKSGQWSIEDDAAAINTDYPDEGHVMNCTSCTTAYELRRRGYDVEAIYMKNGKMREEVETWYKGSSFTKYKSDGQHKTNSEGIYSQFSNCGDGARGVVSVTWKEGGRHIMNWENIGGQTYIVDCQSNKVYPQWKFERSVSQKVNWDDVAFMRVDNLELTEKVKDMIHERN